MSATSAATARELPSENTVIAFKARLGMGDRRSLTSAIAQGRGKFWRSLPGRQVSGQFHDMQFALERNCSSKSWSIQTVNAKTSLDTSVILRKKPSAADYCSVCDDASFSSGLDSSASNSSTSSLRYAVSNCVQPLARRLFHSTPFRGCRSAGATRRGTVP